MPEISVIIPVYNAAPYLDKCIGSVLDQDYKDFELILVNDGSTDNSLEICREWAQKDARIIVLDKENGGQSEARNLGIEKAVGKYLSFVDSDDYITTDYLSYLLGLFAKSDKCSMTVCNRQYIKNGQLRQKFNYISDEGVVFNQTECYRRALLSQISHGPWARLYKREVFDKLRYPVRKKHEDTYILGDLIEADEEIVFGNKVCYWYVVHGESTVHTNNLSRLNDLIDATEHFAEMAVQHDPALRNEAVCKVAHARLSALSLLERNSQETRKQAKQWKKEILKDRSIILKEKENLKRDKLAVVILTALGIPGYSTAFRLYEKLLRSV